MVALHMWNVLSLTVLYVNNFSCSIDASNQAGQNITDGVKNIGSSVTDGIKGLGGDV